MLNRYKHLNVPIIILEITLSRNFFKKIAVPQLRQKQSVKWTNNLEPGFAYKPTQVAVGISAGPSRNVILRIALCTTRIFHRHYMRPGLV